MIKKFNYSEYILLFFFLVYSLFNSLLLNAQKFERFSNKEGFNQNTIKTISQDRYGFLWFGTPNGLIKYDGYEFETFTTQTNTEGRISSNAITDLHNDSNGILWIGTNVGINVYVPWLEKFLEVPLVSKLSINQISSDPNGTIWFSGENKLFTCTIKDINKGLFKVSKNLLAKGDKVSQINQFSFIDSNSIILATSNGIKKVIIRNTKAGTGKTIENLINYENFAHKNITSIKKTKNILWIGTNNDINKTTIDNNRIHVIRHYDIRKNKTDSLHNEINPIFEDNNGDIWIGTVEYGLLKYLEEDDKFISYTYNPKNDLGLSSNHINSIYQDNYNVLWIGTAQGGLNKLDISQKEFINYSKNPYIKQSITDNLITSILEDSKGKLWISTYSKNIYRSISPINNKTANAIKFEDLSKQLILKGVDSRVRHIYEDSQGYIWLGTDSHVLIYSPLKDKFKKIDFFNKGKIIPKQLYRSIFQIDDKNLLLMGNEILVIQNPWNTIENSKNPQIEIKSKSNTNSKTIYNTIIKDKHQQLWFGSNNGLYYGVFNGEKIIIKNHISDEKKNDDNLKISYSNVFSLHEDYEGNIWVGTFGGGLNKISLNNTGKPIKIDYFRNNDILPDDAIYGILQKENNALWISTDMGIVKYSLKTNTVDVFDVRDGLAQNNFRQGAYFHGKSGFFYFGGLNGLTIFKPENIKLNTTPPKIIITSFLINNKDIKIGDKIDDKVVLEKSISETNEISISQDKQTIAFELVVEHTSVPSKNKLAYKLEGFNDSWIENQSGKAIITYTNLSAGDYIFKVKAANSDGLWSPNIRNLKITILPPWHQTWWSYVLFFLLFTLIGIGVFIYFIQHEKLKQRLIYEKLDKERLDTINQGKFRYFTNISHEFRTPLTLISGPLEHIISNNRDNENTKYLSIIQKNTKRLLSLVDQLITFRKAEQGFIDLHLSKKTLGEFIYPTTEAFESYAIEKNINFFFKINSPNEKIIIDVEKVERILFNLLSNAFKNTPVNGSISIEANITNNSGTKMIQIDVIDNGKGIPAKDLGNIFERFYQLGNNENTVSGGGIGLAFCKSLINLLEGNISVKSEPFKETRFTVFIPSSNIEDYNSLDVTSTKKSVIKDWVPLSTEYKNETLNAISNNEQKAHHLLIVEDEEDVQNFLTSTLSKKYNITIANNGIDGLKKVKSNEPTLIVSDVMMPEMDGFSFCNKIKSNPDTCHIPVLLLTALGTNEDTIKGLEFGADEYISKPFSLKLLELRIKKLIENNIRLKEHFTKSSSIPREGIELSSRDEAFIKNIIVVMDENISNSNFGVGELSEKMNLSTSQFYRRLKQLTGQIPNVYLRNYRLQKAAELLKRNDGTNVTEVMYQIGIESNSYFSTSFKKLHGISPSEYLKKHIRTS